MKYISRFFQILCFLFLIFSVNYSVEASASIQLKNGDAFSGRNNYYSYARYKISPSSYSQHMQAWGTAVNKMNAIPGANINLYGGLDYTVHINMSSVNTSNYDWYGHASWNKNSASLRLNHFTTTKKNFSTANYNKTAMHELGHAFYMKHQISIVNSVMKQGKFAYNDYTSLDKSNLSFMYYN